MNDINKLFFELIRVALGNADSLSLKPSDKEWRLLYDMAKKQSLVGICFAAVQRLPEDERPPEMLYLTQRRYSREMRWSIGNVWSCKRNSRRMDLSLAF